MEETFCNVPQYNNQVVSSTAFDYEFNLSDKLNHSLAGYDSCDNINNNNLLLKQSKDSVDDDVTSCSSDTETLSIHDNSSTKRRISMTESLVSNDEANHPDKLYPIDPELSQEVGNQVFELSTFKSLSHFAQSRIDRGLETESFLITNLNTIIQQFHLWKQELPMVTPFYAVKCLPDVSVVRLLASLGCSFDCATQGEIELVLNGLGDELNFSSRGIAGSSIVYANPAKMTSMIRYAVDNGVRMTVFDGEDELYKIAKVPGHEKLQLLLRLTTEDKASVCQFSHKFGCPVKNAPKLLEIAKSLNLNVAGVSFHVGSGCGDANAYTIALEHTRRVFDAAEALGMTPMHIIDIGGGFPGDTGGYGGPNMPTFQDLAAAVRAGLDSFQNGLNRSMDEIRVIAEPGRFFVSASTIVFTKIYSRRGGSGKSQALYVDDGVYGTFNNIIYDHAHPIPLKLQNVVSGLNYDSEETLPTVVFGPTCDGLDQLCNMDNTMLPRCDVEDWLQWDNMGAYTHTASFVFNGYTHIPSRLYCV